MKSNDIQAPSFLKMFICLLWLQNPKRIISQTDETCLPSDRYKNQDLLAIKRNNAISKAYSTCKCCLLEFLQLLLLKFHLHNSVIKTKISTAAFLF